MVRWLMLRAVSAFERQWNYDASYLREMIEASPRAAWHFLRATRLGNYGLPGLIVYAPDGSVQSVAFEIVHNLVRAIYAVSNPMKLSHLLPPV